MSQNIYDKIANFKSEMCEKVNAQRKIQEEDLKDAQYVYDRSIDEANEHFSRNLKIYEKDMINNIINYISTTFDKSNKNADKYDEFMKANDPVFKTFVDKLGTTNFNVKSIFNVESKKMEDFVFAMPNQQYVCSFKIKFSAGGVAFYNPPNAIDEGKIMEFNIDSSFFNKLNNTISPLIGDHRQVRFMIVKDTSKALSYTETILTIHVDNYFNLFIEEGGIYVLNNFERFSLYSVRNAMYSLQTVPTIWDKWNPNDLPTFLEILKYKYCIRCLKSAKSAEVAFLEQMIDTDDSKLKEKDVEIEKLKEEIKKLKEEHSNFKDGVMTFLDST